MVCFSIGSLHVGGLDIPVSWKRVPNRDLSIFTPCTAQELTVSCSLLQSGFVVANTDVTTCLKANESSTIDIAYCDAINDVPPVSSAGNALYAILSTWIVISFIGNVAIGIIALRPYPICELRVPDNLVEIRPPSGSSAYAETYRQEQRTKTWFPARPVSVESAFGTCMHELTTTRQSSVLSEQP